MVGGEEVEEYTVPHEKWNTSYCSDIFLLDTRKAERGCDHRRVPRDAARVPREAVEHERAQLAQVHVCLPEIAQRRRVDVTAHYYESGNVQLNAVEGAGCDGDALGHGTGTLHAHNFGRFTSDVTQHTTAHDSHTLHTVTHRYNTQHTHITHP